MADPSGKLAWFIIIPAVMFLVAWAEAVITSPDIHQDIAAISNDYESGDKTAFGIDLVCAAVPILPAGGGKISKALKGAVSKPSNKSVIKAAELPTSGKIRYVPPKTWTSTQRLPMSNNGYVDKFGNVWSAGPSRTAGQAFEWDVQLSRTGKSQLGQFTRDGSHLNVSLDGEITHK